MVLVDLADPRQTVTFNPIEQLPGVSAGEQAAELIAAFKKIWADSWGVRMEDLLRNSLIALSEAERALVDLPAFLTDAGFRSEILTRLTHPIARDYFVRFNQLSDRARLTWSEPVLNKINALLANDHVRQLLAAPHSTVNLRQVMDRGQVLLVKLDKGRLKDSADLLGSLILAKLQLAVFSRSELPVWQRRPFALYVDEFQNFATASFGVLLSEARKYGLSLVLAHQTLAQIPEQLTSLILGNTGLQVVFRVNRRDAERMAKESFSLLRLSRQVSLAQRINYWSLGEEWEQYTEALQNQPPRSAWVKHKIQGGLIPIETVDVDPAWQLLGMSLREYQAQLRALPIGADYLRPRQAPALPMGPSPPRSVRRSRSAGASHRGNELTDARRGGVPPGGAGAPRGDHLSPLPALGTQHRQGRPAPWCLGREGSSDRDRDTLGERRACRQVPAAQLLPPWSASDWCRPTAVADRCTGTCSSWWRPKGPARAIRAEVEFALPSGDAVDVHLSQGAELTAVEIWVGSRLSRELEHVDNCLAAGYDHIICLVFADAMEAELRQAIPERFPTQARSRAGDATQTGGESAVAGFTPLFQGVFPFRRGKRIVSAGQIPFPSEPMKQRNNESTIISFSPPTSYPLPHVPLVDIFKTAPSVSLCNSNEVITDLLVPTFILWDCSRALPHGRRQVLQTPSLSLRPCG